MIHNPDSSIERQEYHAILANATKLDELCDLIRANYAKLVDTELKIDHLCQFVTTQFGNVTTAQVAELDLLREIADAEQPEPETPATFRVTQGDSMAITGIIPGATGTFAATPLDASGALITTALSNAPVWTSSDPLAVVTPNADGLGCSVAVDATAPQGGSFVLTIANPDGSASTPTTVPYDNVVPPPVVASSFSVNQLS